MDFDVLLDFTQDKIILTDTGSYAPGVEQTLKGIVKITQPDGITVEGNFAFPDIVWDGVSDLTKAAKELRRTAQGKPQQGQYIVVYEISDGVQISKKTQIFQLAYTRPEHIIKEQFDVFTPQLQVTDITDYAVGGFGLPNLQRSWIAQIGAPPQTKTGTAVSFDLGIGGVYYDAKYSISLSTIALYTHSSYLFLTVKDTFTTTHNTQANTPPSTDDLLKYVDAIKVRVDEKQPCGDDCCDEQCDYILAFTLYRHIRDRICKNQTAGEPALTDLIQQLLNIYYGYVNDYVNKNVPILPYATGDCGGISGGGGGASATMLEFMVGVTSGAPVDGQSTFTLPALVDHNIVLFIGSILQSKLDNGFGVMFSKPIASDTITLIGQTWTNGSLVQILIL